MNNMSAEDEEPVATALEPTHYDEEDQFVRVLGPIGRWQWLMFILVGLSLIVGTYPVLIMTFMNAYVDFWCDAEAEGVKVCSLI